MIVCTKVPSYLLFILDALTYPYDRVNIHPQFVFYLTVHESTGKKNDTK